MAEKPEVKFNKALATVLREIIAKDAGGSTGWKLEAEQYVTVKYDPNESGGGIPSKKRVKPDILFQPAGKGLEVIIENEFEPAREVEKDAKDKLKQGLELYTGTVTYVKRAFALCIDECFKEGSEISLERKLRLENNNFFICFFEGGERIKRHPTDNWAEASPTKLAELIREPDISKIAAYMFVSSVLTRHR